MKKILLGAAAVVMCISAAGCSDVTSDMPWSGSDEVTETASTSGETATIVAASDVQSGYTVLATSEYDMTGSGTADKVVLATSAANIEGEIMWDDTQKWVLEIETDDGRIHSLFDSNISNGSLYYQVIEDGGELPVIQIYTFDGSSVKIERYSYNGNTFDKMLIHSETGLNVMRSSIPQYR